MQGPQQEQHLSKKEDGKRKTCKLPPHKFEWHPQIGWSITKNQRIRIEFEPTRKRGCPTKSTKKVWRALGVWMGCFHGTQRGDQQLLWNIPQKTYCDSKIHKCCELSNQSPIWDGKRVGSRVGLNSQDTHLPKERAPRAVSKGMLQRFLHHTTTESNWIVKVSSLSETYHTCIAIGKSSLWHCCMSFISIPLPNPSFSYSSSSSNSSSTRLHTCLPIPIF